MARPSDKLLRELDRALLDLRRFLQTPRVVADGDQQIEMSTLLILDAVSQSTPATITEIAERLQVAHSTASRLVERAVAAGMITRTPQEHSNSSLIAATEAGVAVNDRARDFRHAELTRRLRGWTAEEVRSFSHALIRFAAGPGDEA